MLSMVPFVLANNLLLLNQFPDTHADRQAGRKHFPIAYGERNSLRMYALFVAVAALLIAWLAASGSVTPGLLFALWPLLAAVYAVFGMHTAIRERTSMLPCLAANVIAAVLTPAVMSLTLIVST